MDPDMDLDEPLKMPEDPGGLDYSNLSVPEPMGGRNNSQVSRPTSFTRQGPAPSAAVPPPNQPPTAVPTVQPRPQAPPPVEERGPRSPIVSVILMIFLSLILVAGILVFLSWKGWISLGGLEKLWGGGKPSPTPTLAASVEPSNLPSGTINTNDQTRKADLAKLKDALTKYFADNNRFPLAPNGVKTSDSTSALAQALVPKYLDKLPDDPLAPQYYYGYKSDGQSFELTSVLEDRNDPEGINVGQYFIYKLTGSAGT